VCISNVTQAAYVQQHYACVKPQFNLYTAINCEHQPENKLICPTPCWWHWI